jgi:ATP-dependent RNA helicase RhlE
VAAPGLEIRVCPAKRCRQQESKMQNFSELPISPYMKERLAAARFTIPTPVQEATIPHALAGKDVLATAQTGTGKTLAFLIPIIERLLPQSAREVAALVLVPTRELAMQVVEQYNALRGSKLSPAALVVGGLAEGQQLSALRKGARLVVATPGRLEDFLDRRLIHFSALQTLVLDEADRMLDMGFLPAIRRIVGVLPKQRQTMCFSATLEASVVHLVNGYMKDPVRLAFGSTLKPSENVRLQAFEVALDGKQEALNRLLANEKGRCLVFARTMIHGDRSQSQRTAALTGFQQGRYRVLVATDLASRGIHVQDIAHVINYDLPEVAENFIHRVGRTGRAGGRGVASTLFARTQRSEMDQLERTLGIRMERMRMDGVAPGRSDLPERVGPNERPVRAEHFDRTDRSRGRSGIHIAASPRDARLGPRMVVALPGEVLQPHTAATSAD